MTLNYQDLLELYKMANRLDSSGFYKEADVIDQILIKESGSNKYLAFLAALGLGTPTGIGEEIVSEEISQTPVEEPAYLDYYMIPLKQGQSINDLGKIYFPDIISGIAERIILDYNPEIIERLNKLQIGELIKVPTIDLLEREGASSKYGVNFRKDPNPERVTSPTEELKQIIKNTEEFASEIYDANPPNGDWTIGYGHSIKKSDYNKLLSDGKLNINGVTVYLDTPISESEANKIFEKDIEIATKKTLEKNYHNLNQSHFDALVMFVYNLGSLPNDINEAILNEDFDLVPELFKRYTKSKNVNLTGLEKRRGLEAEIWNDGKK
jgi:GH24 family phage-related lysozyme (muramidase)